MDNPIRFYPYKTIGYETLTDPSTFTNYCYQGFCPFDSKPIYSNEYTLQQLEREIKGTNEYIKSYRLYREDDMNACPVINNNMYMPKHNAFTKNGLAYGNIPGFNAID